MFNKTDPSYFDGEWTFEKTERAVIGLCKILDRYAHKLTLEDLQEDSRCSRIPNLSLERVQEVIADVEAKLWRGVKPIDNEVIYHTGPHHDDIMLGIMPFIMRQLRSPHNQVHFAIMTSGFHSVTDEFLLEALFDTLSLLRRGLIQMVNYPDFFEQGYREVTLLGQNVNSYRWNEESFTFPELMAKVAEVDPQLRVRFATSHPKDLSDSLLEVMAKYPNICRCIHLPVQSGSNRMLKLMNRKYTVEWYLDRVEAIHRYLPDCSITTDVIAGFSTETEEDHQATLELFRKVRYDYAYMFMYSLREGTYAWKHLDDDIPEEEKKRRLNEIIALQGEIALENNQKEVGREYEVLVEGESHRSKQQLFGRNSQNKVIVFDRGDAVAGSYRRVKVISCTAATLIGELVQ